MWHKIYYFFKNNYMNRLFKFLIAGYAAKRYGGNCLGGGIVGAIIVFVIVYWLLGRMGC